MIVMHIHYTAFTHGTIIQRGTVEYGYNHVGHSFTWHKRNREAKREILIKFNL